MVTRRSAVPTRQTLRGRLFPPHADALPWTRNDALLTVGAAVVDLVGYTAFSQVTGVPVSSVGVLLLTVSALPLLMRRRFPLTVMTVILVLGALLNLTVATDQHFGAVLTVALYSAARAGRPWATATLTIGAIGVTLLTPNFAAPRGFLNVTSACLAACLIVGAALAVNRWQQETEANRRLLADRAVAEERRHIARELHDVVAHRITTMQLMAGGARANLDHDPGAARDALVTLEGSGRLALREMRQLLDVLRADEDTAADPHGAPEAPQPGLADLDRLIKESRQAGQPAELTVDGDPGQLPPVFGLTLYRIVQEALTNARKHAGPDVPVEVRLTCLPERVRVSVADRGATDRAQSAPAVGIGTGYGLIGMRERVALHGGTLKAGPLPEAGFRVVANLPLEAPTGEDKES
ncbi:sensor histidine kinase [Wenjunlia tyrosinilytica]|uniref:histidine kinase n=1 Tax=Wenjunlia tyrosinilytica TaxID=1544741 RepID=A0A918E0V4_9ACTN|nr:sensor histidine kinase [Wenjunlia tyrosinilytica]GGO99697.1 two-component sensor histidine kinase [Wenjunlia tyrosinilytica]